MSLSKRIKHHLDTNGFKYETVRHPRSACSSETAQKAHVPGDCVAKSVVIHHEEGYVLAVVPSSHRVDLRMLQELIDRRMGLASEDEVETLFSDCDKGAVPPVGELYGIATLVDTSLEGKDAVWFEGGDHQTLVKMSGKDFDNLTKDYRHATFSHHV